MTMPPLGTAPEDSRRFFQRLRLPANQKYFILTVTIAGSASPDINVAKFGFDTCFVGTDQTPVRITDKEAGGAGLADEGIAFEK